MSRRQDDVEIYTQLSDALYDELNQLCGQEIAHIQLWEDSLADSLEEEDIESNDVDEEEIYEEGAEDDIDSEQRMLFDLDIYLKDGVYFELLATICYPSLESEPLQGYEKINKLVQRYVKSGIRLAEVAVGEEDELIMVLGHPQQAMLYLAVGGWLINSWEELPV